MYVCDMFVYTVLRIYSPYIQYCLSLEIGIPFGIPKRSVRLIGAGHVEVHRSRSGARRCLKTISWDGPPPKSFHYKLAKNKKSFAYHDLATREVMSLIFLRQNQRRCRDSTPNVAPLDHVPLRPQHLEKKIGEVGGRLVQKAASNNFGYFWVILVFVCLKILVFPLESTSPVRFGGVLSEEAVHGTNLQFCQTLHQINLKMKRGIILFAARLVCFRRWVSVSFLFQ